MPYITERNQAKDAQLTWEDILYGTKKKSTIYPTVGGTITRFYHTIPDKLNIPKYIEDIIDCLEKFVELNKDLYPIPRKSLYHTFYIPKKSGGLRKIDEPNPVLMEALRNLKSILENTCGMLYHTSAYAYIKSRSCVNAIQRHQNHGSNWFLKIDFSNFFGSSTKDFVYTMLTKSYPLSEVVKHTRGRAALEKALDLCFLEGGLPQGTPVSPTLTNIMMIPFDHQVANRLAELDFVYTRYADDILVSAKQHFDMNKVIKIVKKTLEEFNAPFEIKSEKTRYGSRKGSNWNLGLMLNKDNNITVGHMKKKYFKAAICNFIADHINGKCWSAADANQLAGTISYYRMVEADYIDYVISHHNQKFGVNLMEMIKRDIEGKPA